MDNVFDPSVPDHGVYAPNSAAASHLRSLRMRPGETVNVLDGRGRAVVVRLSTDLQYEVASVSQVQKPSALIVCIGVLDHRERFEFAVEKSVELGATEIVPLLCERSSFLRSSMDRLRAKVEAAVTQSGQRWLPQLWKPCTLQHALDAVHTEHSKLVCVMGDQDGVRPRTGITPTEPVFAAVGPEGGFSDNEKQMLLKAGALRWTIGSARLRTETAVVSLLTAVALSRETNE